MPHRTPPNPRQPQLRRTTFSSSAIRVSGDARLRSGHIAGLDPECSGKADGVQVGEKAAAAILAQRANDGSAAAPIPFVPGTKPGDYQLTPPAFAQPVFTHWRFVTPFTLRKASQFLPAPPPPLTSATYTADFNEVKSLGDITAPPAPRTQTVIAKFWGAPIQNYWNEIAQTTALQHGTTLDQNARLFALLDLSLADSVIAFYDAKYTYAHWRRSRPSGPRTPTATRRHRRSQLDAVGDDGPRPVLPRSSRDHQRRRRGGAGQLLRVER
jgi:hypothetical protein